jgi:transcription antitermination protein NusB
MSFRKQTRSIARELALLSLGQLNSSPTPPNKQDLDGIVLTAVRALMTEICDILETATSEVKRGSDRLEKEEIDRVNVDSAKAMVKESLELAQKAIDRLGLAIELPEFIQMASKTEVRKYAIQILETIQQQKTEIEQTISEVLVSWQLNRLPRLDRDILIIAVAEIKYLEIPKKVAINEAVELAKRYTDEEGYRFINGVLRKVTDRMEATAVL